MRTEEGREKVFTGSLTALESDLVIGLLSTADLLNLPALSEDEVTSQHATHVEFNIRRPACRECQKLLSGPPKIKWDPPVEGIPQNHAARISVSRDTKSEVSIQESPKKVRPAFLSQPIKTLGDDVQLSPDMANASISNKPERQAHTLKTLIATQNAAALPKRGRQRRRKRSSDWPQSKYHGVFYQQDASYSYWRARVYQYGVAVFQRCFSATTEGEMAAATAYDEFVKSRGLELPLNFT